VWDVVQVDVQELNRLTATPHADDVITACLPVAAPYSVLQSYKFKAKLLPGGQKKGRAARTTMDAFSHHRVRALTLITLIALTAPCPRLVRTPASSELHRGTGVG